MTHPAQLPEYLRSIVGSFLARDVEFPDGTLVSCTRVDVAGNRQHATAWLSVLPPARAADALTRVTERLPELQRTVHTVIRGQAPRLAVRLDEGPAHAARIEALAHDLSKNPDGSERP